MYFKLSKNVVFEKFDEGGLAFILSDCRLIELDRTTRDIIKKFEKGKQLQDIAVELAKEKNMSLIDAKKNVKTITQTLKKAGILQTIDSFKADQATSARYAQNPKIIVKKTENNDGAVLFNQETNQIKIINRVGLYIWRQCSIYTTLKDIISKLEQAFDDVPRNQVARDVYSFLTTMSTGDFIKVQIQDSIE